MTWASGTRRSGARPEYAVRPRVAPAVPSPALRRRAPLAIAVHVNRNPELRERPPLFVPPRFDTHIKEDIQRLRVGQPAVLMNVVDDVGVGALDVLRIDLKVFDQRLFGALFVLLGQTHSGRVSAQQRF